MVQPMVEETDGLRKCLFAFFRAVAFARITTILQRVVSVLLTIVVIRVAGLLATDRLFGHVCDWIEKDVLKEYENND